EANSLCLRLPPKYRNVPADPDWDRIPADAREAYRGALEQVTAIEGIEGGAVVALVGDRGSGKTWMACCLIGRFASRGRPAMYAEATDYFADLRATYGDRGTGSERE